jgi:hypothetical protein
MSTGDFMFKEIDLSEDWADYDEENDISVSIMEIQTQIVKK